MSYKILTLSSMLLYFHFALSFISCKPDFSFELHDRDFQNYVDGLIIKEGRELVQVNSSEAVTVTTINNYNENHEWYIYLDVSQMKEVSSRFGI